MGELFDSQAVIDDVAAALAGAEPFAAVPLLVGQVPFLAPEAAVDLLRRIVVRVHPGTWGFTDEVMKGWPAIALAFVLEQIRALPAGPLRIEALCGVPSSLTLSEKREVLDRILARALSRLHHAHPLISNCELMSVFVRMLPEEWQEEWIRVWALDDDGVPGVSLEYNARRDIDRLSESALRDMWSRIDHTSEPDEVPDDYFWFASKLPADLRMTALERIRACRDQDNRLHFLMTFDEELTCEERRELVEVVPNEYIRSEPWAQTGHLGIVEDHLPNVANDLHHKWLDAVLSFDSDRQRQLGLMSLLPVLTGPRLKEAKQALVSAVIAKRGFVTCDCRWDLIADERFAPIIYRLGDEEFLWGAEQAIPYIVEHRDEALVERCLIPLLASLPSLSDNACLEAVLAMTPWLARVTDGSFPLALASLAIPGTLAVRGNPDYWK